MYFKIFQNISMFCIEYHQRHHNVKSFIEYHYQKHSLFKDQNFQALMCSNIDPRLHLDCPRCDFILFNVTVVISHLLAQLLKI